MKTKYWALLVFSAFLLATGFLVGLSVCVQTAWGPDWREGVITGGEVIFREHKTKYISQKNVPYTAYILGGSKAGFLQTETYNAYSGESWYNFFTNVGLFSNYERFCSYIVNSQKDTVKEIVVHLSTYEASNYDDKVYVPFEMQQNLFGKIKSYVCYLKERYINVSYISSVLRYKRNKFLSIKRNGELINNPSVYALFARAPEAYSKQYVLNAYQVGIAHLFTQEARLSACKKNIATLRQIKERCDENGVKLTVVIGAHFISAFGSQYGEDFNTYLRDLVSVMGGVWNFCGINDVNMNPYNFYNSGHYWEFTGDKMIETMYSPEPNTTDLDAFGILLTPGNIDAYIESQRQKWLALKAEYDATGTIALQGKADATGTIALQGKTDASYLGK